MASTRRAECDCLPSTGMSRLPIVDLMCKKCIHLITVDEMEDAADQVLSGVS